MFKLRAAWAGTFIVVLAWTAAAQAADREGTHRGRTSRQSTMRRVPTPGQSQFNAVRLARYAGQEDVPIGVPEATLPQTYESFDEVGNTSSATDQVGCAMDGAGSCGCGEGNCCSGDGNAYGCDPCGCGELVGDCCGCFQPFGLAAGVEATYLKPDVDRDDSFDPLRSYDFAAAPRVWVQYQTASGWGLRGRYWTMTADQQFTAITVQDEDIAFTQSYDDDLQMDATDLEMTRAFHVEQVNGWLFCGARHGRLHRDGTLFLANFDLGGGGGDDASAILQEIDRTFEGTGPTFGIDLIRPIAQSRLAAVFSLRGSVLWGDNDATADVTVVEVVPAGVGDLDLNDFGTLQVAGNDRDAMWIGELQAGGEWDTPLNQAFGGGNAFLRVVFEAQWWNVPGLSVTPIEEDVNDSLYDLLGVSASAGFRR